MDKKTKKPDMTTNSPMQKPHSNWLKLLWIILIIWGVSLIVSGLFEIFTTDSNIGLGNVAIIPINGEITTGEGGAFSSDVANSYDIIRLIDEAEENDEIKAIVFEINSPGGSPVATDEIATRIKKIEKPKIALIREVGASGAYWAATSTDHIIANRMSIVGSIGVYSSYLDFSRFLNRYNITYTRLVAGEYKDMGSPFKELTQDERIFLQNQLDILHGYFIQEVATNRNLSYEHVSNLSNGLFYLGSQGLELGLVDELGGRDEVKVYLSNQHNITSEFVIYQKQESFMDMLRSFSLQKRQLTEVEIQRYINQQPQLMTT